MSAAHILGMMIEKFKCPKCGMWYEVTRTQSPDAKPGHFDCTDCKAQVHSWSGIDQYSEWTQSVMRAPRR
jgi:transposase-like protein